VYDAMGEQTAIHYGQLMCECCGFCITLAITDDHSHRQLQSRFENRCPVMLYSQMAGMAAGRVTRRCVCTSMT